MFFELIKLGLKVVDKGLEEGLKFLDDIGRVETTPAQPSNYWEVINTTYIDAEGKHHNLDRSLSETYSEYWREFKAELED